MKLCRPTSSLRTSSAPSSRRAAELGGQQRRGGDAEDHGDRHPARRPQRDPGDDRKDDEGGGAAFRHVGPDHRQLQRRKGQQREQAGFDPALGRDALFAAVGQDEEAGRDGQDAAGVAAPEQQHVVPIVGPAGDAERVHHIERGERVEQRADRRADGDQRRDVAQPPQRAVESDQAQQQDADQRLGNRQGRQQHGHDRRRRRPDEVGHRGADPDRNDGAHPEAQQDGEDKTAGRPDDRYPAFQDEGRADPEAQEIAGDDQQSLAQQARADGTAPGGFTGFRLRRQS